MKVYNAIWRNKYYQVGNKIIEANDKVEAEQKFLDYFTKKFGTLDLLFSHVIQYMGVSQS